MSHPNSRPENQKKLKDILMECLIASAAGGALSLDRTAALQVMVSRPIVMAPVIAFLLGDIKTGLLAGGMLELFWIGKPPVGGYIPPHEALMTALITTVSVLSSREFSVAGISGLYPFTHVVFVVGFCVIVLLPLNMIFARLDSFARKINAGLFDAALSGLNDGLIEGVERSNFKGILSFFLPGFIALLIMNVIGVLFVSAVFPLMSEAIIRSLPVAFSAVIVVGIAAAFNVVRCRGSLPVFLAAAFFALVIAMWFGR